MRIPMHKQKQWIRQLKPDIPRVSFYRMVRSSDFAELCGFYASGIGSLSFHDFASLASQLERTFGAAAE